MLFTANEYQQLMENGKKRSNPQMLIPVAKWIIPEFGFQFLATMIKPFTSEIETAHGFGMRNNGQEQLSRTYIRTNGNHRELVGMDARSDTDFIAAFPIWVYEKIAIEKGSLITNADTVRALLDSIVVERETA